MTKREFLDKMLSKEKISKERYDNGIVKIQEKETAKERYKIDKTKLIKSELLDLLDTLME